MVSTEYLDLVGKNARKIDKDDSITMKFDEKRDKFDITERCVDSSGELGVTPDGGLGLSTEKSFFTSKSTSKEFSFTFGRCQQDQGWRIAHPELQVRDQDGSRIRCSTSSSSTAGSRRAACLTTDCLRSATGLDRRAPSAKVSSAPPGCSVGPLALCVHPWGSGDA
ncbi:MAG TPA: hypothetical protein VHZ81_15490 [Galbitalea sp.]|nr:hypothetical protein [Galbitalea sp.]